MKSYLIALLATPTLLGGCGDVQVLHLDPQTGMQKIATPGKLATSPQATTAPKPLIASALQIPSNEVVANIDQGPTVAPGPEVDVAEIKPVPAKVVNAGTQSKVTELVLAHPTIEAPVILNMPPPAPLSPPQTKILGTPTDQPLAPNDTALVSQAGASAAQAAREAATDTAKPGDYIDAVAVYDYTPGRVYHIFTSPNFLTAISLRAGEKLLSKAAADTIRWQVGDTLTGTDASQTILVVIKPLKAGLRTNLILTTNERTYFLDLESRPGNQYQNAVRWNYPQENLAVSLAQVGKINEQRKDTALAGVDIEKLNYDYRIRVQSGSKPNWLPQDVFDDGQKTYINFPADLGTMEAPPLYVLTSDKQADLVNYRVKGHFYVVDRLFDRAELRLGHAPQTVVSLERSKRVETGFWPW
jgi:P-type conjugative transfer protein TrbG